RQSSAAGIEGVLKMFARSFEIFVCEGDPAHAEFESHVNNRDSIFIEFFFRLEQTDRAAGRGFDRHTAGADAANDSSQTSEPARSFRRRTFRLLHVHLE